LTSDAEVRGLFRSLVNMSRDELLDWLASQESRSVGQRTSEGESIGHASGRRIVSILDTPADELTDDDTAHMRKVIGFIRRHRAQEPANIYTSRWRYSLMNWGHDPTWEES
jgi:predicted NAD/FAD-dependent oxidoreductase